MRRVIFSGPMARLLLALGLAYASFFWLHGWATRERSELLDVAFGQARFKPGVEEPVDIPIPEVEARKPENQARIARAELLADLANACLCVAALGLLWALHSLARLVRLARPRSPAAEDDPAKEAADVAP
jgi:hypothetical protein